MRLAVDLNAVAKLNSLSDVGWLCVDRNTAFQNQLLHLQARAEARLRQHLVKLGCFRHRRQNPLGRSKRNVVFVGVELPRHYIIKSCRARRKR